MRRIHTVWLWLLLTSLSGCVAHGGLGAADGVNWRRLASERIELTTTLNETEAVAAFDALERDYATIVAAFGELAGKPGPAKVVVFGSRAEFKERYGSIAEAFTLFGNDVNATYLLLEGNADSWVSYDKGLRLGQSSTARHELTHLIMGQAMALQPKWFSEGVASYLEPLSPSANERHVVIGGVKQSAFAALRSSNGRSFETMPVEQLMRDENALDRLFYPTAWAFTHYMINEQQLIWSNFMAELVQRVSFDDAQTHLLRALDLEGIDDALRRYLAHGEFRVSERAITPQPTAKPRPLSALEWAIIRARLLQTAGESRAAAEAADQGLVVAPRSRELRMLRLTTLPKEELKDFVTEWLHADSECTEAWSLIHVLTDDVSLRDEAARHLSLSSLSADQTLNLAMTIAWRGAYEQALKLATVALAMPTDRTFALVVLARTYAGLERWDDAVTTQQLALERARARGAYTRGLEESLAAYRKHEPVKARPGFSRMR